MAFTCGAEAAGAWKKVNRASPSARDLADRHYSRQTVGAPQFVPPGRCLVLLGLDGQSYWVTSWPFARYVKHAWAGAWVCSAFRNEGPGLSSELIRDAVAATVWHWPETPALGMVTFVDPAKVRRKRDPGRCFTRAGFTPAVCPAHGFHSLRPSETDCAACQSMTQGGLVAKQLLPAAFPGPVAPTHAQERLCFPTCPYPGEGV